MFWPLMVLAATIVFNGTYIRIRSNAEGWEPPSLDWVISVRLALAVAGVLLSFIYMKPEVKIGFGSKAIALFALLTLVTAPVAIHPKYAFGYSALLIGCVALTITLAQNAKNLEELEFIGTWWLAWVVLILFKDSAIDLIRGPQSAGESVARLGYQVSTPAEMGTLAALAFWLFVWKRKAIPSSAQIPVCGWMLVVIFLTRARVSMVIWAMGFVLWLWHRKRDREFSFQLKGILVFGSIGLLLTVYLAILFDLPVVGGMVDAFNRSQDKKDMASLTGRTEFWPLIFEKSISSAKSMFAGTGYGMARFGMEEFRGKVGFVPAHTHNSFLECLFTLGVPALLLLVAMARYVFSWWFIVKKAPDAESWRFARQSVIISVLLLMTTLTETFIVKNLNPILILWIYLLVALDRYTHFTSATPQPSAETVKEKQWKAVATS